MLLKSGLLVTVEGIDGSGKSSLITNLLNKLINNNFDKNNITITKEPGGTDLGLKLRKILQERDVQADPKAEFLLFAADRSQHFCEKIIPDLKNNKLIISDRMSDSSLVYQGVGRGLDINIIRDINRWAMSGIKPDLIIYLKIDPEVAYKRVNSRAGNNKENLSSFEKEKKSFMNDISKGFDDLFNGYNKINNNVLILDANLTSLELANLAYNKIVNLINSKKIL